MKVINIIIKTYIALSLLICYACQRSDVLDKITNPISRTILVYMVADNDLSNDAYSDLEEMQQGFAEKGVNLIVFIDPTNSYKRAYLFFDLQVIS